MKETMPEQPNDHLEHPFWVRFLPAPIREKIGSHGTLLDILRNMGWLSFEKVFRFGVGLLVGVWVARYLGTDQFGSLNYAMSFAFLFGSFAGLGLEGIVVREIVRDPGKKDVLLGTSIWLRLIGGSTSLILTAIGASIAGMDGESRVLILICASAFVFQSFDTVDSWFQAKVRSKFTVVTKSAAFFSVSVIKILCILFLAPLWVFALLFTIEIACGSLGLLLAYRIHGNDPLAWRFDGTVARSLLRDSWPLALSGLAIVIYMKIDQVMLGNFLGAHEVGIYSAAVRIVEVWYFIPSVIAVSVFPSIMEAKKKSGQLYLRRLQDLYDIVAMPALVLALLATFFSRPIIVGLYGESYAAASTVLAIYVWSGIAVFLGVASSQYLMAENFVKYSMYRTIIGMVLNVVLNLLLIPKYGTTGSAWATLISFSVSTFSLVVFPRTHPQVLMMLKSLIPMRRLVMAGKGRQSP